MINITVNFHTLLSEDRAEAQETIQLEANTTVRALLESLELPLPVGQILIVRNGQNARLGEKLLDGDLLDLIPAIEGG